MATIENGWPIAFAGVPVDADSSYALAIATADDVPFQLDGPLRMTVAEIGLVLRETEGDIETPVQLDEGKYRRFIIWRFKATKLTPKVDKFGYQYPFRIDAETSGSPSYFGLGTIGFIGGAV